MLLRGVPTLQELARAGNANSPTILDRGHACCTGEPPQQRAPFQSRNRRHGGKRNASSVPHVDPLLRLQHGSISVRLRRREACKIARLTRGWIRSEERRVGKELRSRWTADDDKKK